jgi:hypothetical protein
LEGGPPSFPQGCSCPVVLTHRSPSQDPFAYRALTVSGHAFQQCSARLLVSQLGGRAEPLTVDRPSNPSADIGIQTTESGWFGLLPVRSPLLGEYSLVLALLRCFSLGGAPRQTIGFICRSHPLPDEGLPHSEIAGSPCAVHSPTLFAAAHVLLRHSTPRHPPHAFVPSHLVSPVRTSRLLLVHGA